ncbi:MAG: hypothetical protein J0I06_15715 [Planctomycetes bacterium]|nr:hypothetical protein [Planctomycetota bacterium]
MTQTYTPTHPATSATSRSLGRVPVVVWAVATLLALAFVTVIGTNAPYADEWEFVPALLGDEPALPWLWQQHNEHRLPLPRLVVLALFRLTHDFRAGMVLQVAMLSALALYLIRLAARLRGRGDWSDCFFPISLLHTGHWENFVMGYQVCFALFAVLTTALAVVALRTTRENAFRSGTIAGALLVLIALTGGSGLVVVPVVALWVAFLAVNVWRDGSKGRALILLFLTALPAVYIGVYFVDYHKPAHHPAPSSDPLAVGRVAGEVLAMALGVGVSPVWWAVFAAMLALGTATLVRLLRLWREPSERPAVAGLIAVAAGVTGVAMAIGVGRGGWGGGMGLWSRYSLLVWPLLAMTYLVWVKLGAGWNPQTAVPRTGLPSRSSSRWVPIGLCVAAALAFPANTGFGMVNGALIKGKYSDIEADAGAGLSAEEIVKRRFPDSHQVGQEERAVRAIPLLRDNRIGIFAR